MQYVIYPFIIFYFFYQQKRIIDHNLAFWWHSFNQLTKNIYHHFPCCDRQNFTIQIKFITNLAIIIKVVDLQYNFKMLAEQTDKFDAPTEPIIKPMAHDAFVDDFSLEVGQDFVLFQEKNLKGPYLYHPNKEEENFTRLMDPQCHKRRFQDLLTNTGRSMISKLERMDRVPTKKRHY